MLSISESFRDKWEQEWDEVLDELAVDHLSLRTSALEPDKKKQVRYMLNWIDWLGAMAASGAIEDLGVLLSSIEYPLKRILNAGYSIIEQDIRLYGEDYWRNLLLVAQEMNCDVILELKKQQTNQCI